MQRFRQAQCMCRPEGASDLCACMSACLHVHTGCVYVGEGGMCIMYLAVHLCHQYTLTADLVAVLHHRHCDGVARRHGQAAQHALAACI